MINVNIKSNLIKIDFKLERRISVIKGYSGAGKSLLCDILSSTDYQQYVNTTPKNYNVIVVNSQTVSAVIRNETNAIIFADDLTVVEGDSFAKLCSRYLVENNLYIVLFTRAETKFDSENEISFSMDCIYKMIDIDGIKKVLKPYYEFSDLRKAESLDCVITEDKTAGNQFFSKLYNNKNVYSANSGKSTIIQDVLDRCFPNYSILIVVDRASFGCHAEELQFKIFNAGYSVFLLSGYECFEELLLNTNFFKEDDIIAEVLKNPSEFANSRLSWELYFEELINRATKRKPYRHTHSTDQLFNCYWMSCDCEQSCVPQIKSKCLKKVKGDKFVWMLTNTKYAILLNFYERDFGDSKSCNNDLKTSGKLRTIAAFRE